MHQTHRQPHWSKKEQRSIEKNFTQITAKHPSKSNGTHPKPKEE